MTNALANKQGQLAPLKSVDPKDIIGRYLSDERTADIAASLNVHRSALNQWLLKTCEDDWKAAQVARAITAKDEATDALASATDALSLARAREQLRAAQWDLERVCRRIYGQDQPPAGAAQVAIQINLRRSGATNANDAGQQEAIITGSVLNKSQPVE